MEGQGSDMNEKLAQILDEKQLDAVILSNTDNIRYVSGYCGDTGLLFLSPSRSVVMTDFRYIYQVKMEAAGCEAVDIGKDGYAAAIAKLVEAESCKRIGFEAEHLFCAALEEWKEKSPSVEFVNVEEELGDIRIIKNAYEIEQLRQAEHIGDLAFAEILDYLKPGVTELEIAARLEFSMKMHSASGNSFDPIVASGINSSMPHAVPSNKKLEKGDFVTLDFGCKYNGYCSDMTRTVVIGKASEKQKSIYETVLKAQEAVLQQVKPGMLGRDIDAIARNIIDAAGYEGCFGHGLGHGTGLNIHESPRASAKYDKPVTAGMTLTVEPGIYIKDFGGVRIEDMIVFTEDGYENLTFSPKHLIEL